MALGRRGQSEIERVGLHLLLSEPLQLLFLLFSVFGVAASPDSHWLGDVAGIRTSLLRRLEPWTTGREEVDLVSSRVQRRSFSRNFKADSSRLLMLDFWLSWSSCEALMLCLILRYFLINFSISSNFLIIFMPSSSALLTQDKVPTTFRHP
jgi:hypothetical protein